MDLNLLLQGVEEEIPKEVCLDFMLSGLMKATEFKFHRHMHHREESTSVYRLQKTTNSVYVNQQSRNASRGPSFQARGAH